MLDSALVFSLLSKSVILRKLLPTFLVSFPISFTKFIPKNPSVVSIPSFGLTPVASFVKPFAFCAVALKNPKNESIGLFKLTPSAPVAASVPAFNFSFPCF